MILSGVMHFSINGYVLIVNQMDENDLVLASFVDCSLLSKFNF
jgi:hypothetical protein